jgi:hypothetical protein
MRTFRGGLLIGMAAAVLVAAIAVAYEIYDTRTLKRTGPLRRSAVRRQQAAAWLLDFRRSRQLDRLRCRLLPRGRSRHFRRAEKGKVRSARSSRSMISTATTLEAVCGTSHLPVWLGSESILKYRTSSRPSSQEFGICQIARRSHGHPYSEDSIY